MNEVIFILLILIVGMGLVLVFTSFGLGISCHIKRYYKFRRKKYAYF